jgi:acetyl-CoA synthetase
VAEAHEVDIYHVPKAFWKQATGNAHLKTTDVYETLYKELIADPSKTWSKLAHILL